MIFTMSEEIKDEYLTEPKIDTVIEMLKMQSERVAKEFYNQALLRVEELRYIKHKQDIGAVPKEGK